MPKALGPKVGWDGQTPTGGVLRWASPPRGVQGSLAPMSFYDQAKEVLVANTPLGDNPLTHTLASLVAGWAPASEKGVAKFSGWNLV